MTRFLIVAGETSGEVYGARLMREIKAQDPDVTFTGIGGDKMREEGLKMLHHCRDMAALGLSQILSKLFFFLGVISQIGSKIRAGEFDAVILIDYPGFNFRMAKAAFESGVPVIYYVLPQVWAWRRYRVKALKKYVDTLICTLPFEPEFYAGYEVKTHFVGHPMLDEISPPVDASSLKRYFLPPGCVTLIGLLPGSRNGEVKEILPTLLMTADVIRSKMPQVGFIIPIAPNLNDNFIRTAIGDRKYIATVSGRSHDVMSCADFIITKSGTSTLETALFDVPAAVVYKAQFLSYWSAIYIVNLKTAALPNLIAGKDVVREFYQYEFIPENVANHVLEMLGSQSMISERKKWMEIVRQKLGEKGAAKRAATIIINRMKELFKKEGLHVS